MADPKLPAAEKPGKRVRGDSAFRVTKSARTAKWQWRRSLDEDTSYEWFKSIRFRDNGGEPFCPACECPKYYTIANRPKWWSCANPKCRKQYSVTSGTIFHSRKIEFVRLVELILRFAESAKGTSACELGISADGAYTTLFVNLMKMREAMSSQRDHIMLGGTVEMDVGWFNGKIRKKNMEVDRKNVKGRSAEYHLGKRAMFVARERGGKSVMFAADNETTDVAVATVREIVRPGGDTKVVTDHAPAYKGLELIATHEVVNHEFGYKVNGISTNWAESAISRPRRALIGVYHHWAPTWLDFYAGEMGWRADNNRLGNLEQAIELVALACRHPQSRNLKGYWQHWQLPDDQRQRGEVRFARVHSNLVAKPPRKVQPRRPKKGAEEPDQGPVTVQKAKPFVGHGIPRPPPR